MKVDISGDSIKIFDFNARESLEIARRLEAESVDFYKGLRKKVDGAVGKVIDVLIEEEKRHLAYFENVIEKLGPEETETDLVEIVDSGVVSPFRDAGNIEEVLCNRDEAVKLGLAIEKRAVAFYEQLLSNTHDETGRIALEKIIEEEKSHEESLRAML